MEDHFRLARRKLGVGPAMRAVVVENTGPPSVLRVTDVVAREPGPA